MLWVYRSNRVEKLAASLTALSAEPLGGPMEMEWVCVGAVGMRHYLERRFARTLGIAAGFKFPFLREVLDTICRASETPDVFDESILTWAVYDLLPAHLSEESFAPIRRFLSEKPSDSKRLGLARKVAQTFSEYILYRPQMILRWEEGNDDHWQAVLWRRLIARHGSSHIARAAVSLLLEPNERLRKLPFRRLSFFCVPSFPPLCISVLSAVAKFIDVYLFMLSPSAEWWADLDAGAVLHPLLSALGRTGSDFQWVLEENAAYLEPVGDLHADPAREGTPSLLRTLQSDILNLRSPKRDGAQYRNDSSLRIHACAGPLRELEVVREQLLELFSSAMPRLSPDEVAVLAPDMGVYAPYIEAVFASEENSIPFSAAGKDPFGASVLSAFLQVLSLVSGRFSLLEVFDLLAAEPVRRKFEMSASDVTALEEWMSEAGTRWGENSQHREMLGQPAFDENTWRFGVDRLLLSLAFDVESCAVYADRSPSRSLTADDKVLLSGFLQFLDVLFDMAAAVRKDHSPRAWQEVLQRAVEGLLIRDAETEGECAALGRCLSNWARDCEAAGFEGAVSFFAVRKYLGARFEELKARKEWHPFGVTFGDMRSFRAVPFRVICLIGLNEADFPRHHRPLGFDLAARHPLRGDRSVLDDDRFQFLEALLSARDALVLTYVGQNAQDASALFYASPVADLLGCIQQHFGLEEDAVIVRHPLAPFSAAYFGRSSDPRLFSRDRAALAGAQAICGNVLPQPAFFHAALQNEPSDKTVDTARLVRFLSSPHRTLLRERLGVQFPWIKKIRTQREPMADAADDRRLTKFLFHRWARGFDIQMQEAAARAQGMMPLGTAGRVRFQRILERVAAFVEKIESRGIGAVLPSIGVDIPLLGNFGTARLLGTIEGVREGGLLRIALSKFDTLLELIALYVDCLAAAAAGLGVREATLLILDTGEQPTFSLRPPEAPHSILTELLEVYFEGLMHPLPYFPEISYAFVEDCRNGKSEEWSLDKARAGFRSLTPERNKEIATLLRGSGPFSSPFADTVAFSETAFRIFAPLLDMRVRERG